MLTRMVRAAATTLLVVAAAALACWFVFSSFAGATLITFRTGSMAPTMPQGTLAMTVPIAADELEVGDVVMLKRASASLPLTHRVIEISSPRHRPQNAADIRAAAPDATLPPDANDPRAREIIMQGDDNDTPDSLPYLVTEARKVVLWVPSVGTALMVLQSPIGWGILLLIVGVVTVWAFWPRAEGVRPLEDADGNSPRDDEAAMGRGSLSRASRAP